MGVEPQDDVDAYHQNYGIWNEFHEHILLLYIIILTVI